MGTTRSDAMMAGAAGDAAIFSEICIRCLGGEPKSLF
jgi:hypothetical protein